jgi:GAF domain-containing protein
MSDASTPLAREEMQFGVRFYAAAPILTSDGYALGVVCIVDHVPRQFSSAKLSALTSLARIALQHIDQRCESLQSHAIVVGESNAEDAHQPSAA